MGSLAYLVSLIVMCLAVAFLLGVLLSYFWRRSSYRRRAADNEQSWLSRLRQTEQDRDSRLAKLRSEVEEQRVQIPTMEKSLAERSDIISDLESQIDAQKESIGSLEKQLRDAQSSGGTAAAEAERVGELEAELAKRSSESAKLDQELNELRAKHNEANARAKEAVSELAAQHEQLGIMEQRVDQVAKQSDDIERVQRRCQKLEQELVESQQALARVEKENATNAASHSQVSAELVRAKERNHDQEQQIKEWERTYREKDVEAVSAQSTIDELNRSLQSARKSGAEVTDLNQTLKRLRSANEEQGGRLTRSELRRTELEQELRTRSEQLTATERDAADQRNKLAESEARNARIEEQLHQLMGQLTASQSQAEDARREFAQWRDQAEQLENQLQAHQSTATEASDQAEHWRNEHDKLKAQWSNHAAQLEESQRHGQTVSHELDQARSEVATLRSKLKDWQQRVDQMDSEAAGRVRDLKTRIVELDALVASSDSSAEEIGMLRRTLEQRDKEHAQMRRDQEAHEEKHRTLQSQFDALKQEHQRCADVSVPASGKTAPKIIGEKPSWLLSEPPTQKDDLKKIWGVGPVMEKTMNSLGIYLFKQVASLEAKDIEWVASHINTFPNRITRDDWVGQAAKFHKEKYG